MSNMARSVLITGGGGFIGRNLALEMARRGWKVRGAVRKQSMLPDGVGQVIVGDIDGQTNWDEALSGIDTVIHLAARAHVLRETAPDPIKSFHRVNVEGGAQLARAAASCEVKRLLYVSSAGVQGLQTLPEKPFTEIDPPRPHNAYTRSKLQAEQALMFESSRSGLEIVIVRPPLVYGANAPGNFAQMIKVLRRGIPLPFASVSNRRSLIYIDNLVDALFACATHSAAAGQTYLVSDGEDISTPELLSQLGAAMGYPARLLPCPLALLKLAGRLTGKSAQVERLLGSLQIDSARIRRELGWQPPYTLQQGLQKTAEWYRDHA